MIVHLMIQLLVACVATISFSILFSTPRREFLFCGITGMTGWLFYLITYSMIESIPLATLIGTIFVTLISRIFAVNRRVPVIVFLIAGIFPLVPGTGIYFTAYYVFMNKISLASEYGRETLGIGLAIAFGIMLAFLIPQKFFNYRGKSKKQDNLIKKWY